MSTSGVARYGGLGVGTDVLRSFNRALEFGRQRQRAFGFGEEGQAGSRERESHPAKKTRAAWDITDAPRSADASDEALDGSSATQCSTLGYSVHIATFPDAGGRGLAASRHLEQGELILRVPKVALMSMLSAKKDPQVAKGITLHPTLSSTQILTVHLLNEVAKGKLSSWHAYLIELPRLHHTLAHFSPCAIQALQVEDAKWVAQKAVKQSMMDWEETKSFMQEIGLRRRFRSLNAWLWASATVSSRTLHVPWDEAGTLCPIGDLFNYAPPGGLYIDSERFYHQVDGHLEPVEENAALEIEDEYSSNVVTIGKRLRDGGYEPDFDEYCFYARQAYEPGQQVLLCYGQYNNLELLEHYGFSMSQNPNDVVHFGLPDSTEFGSFGDHSAMNASGAAYIEVNGRPSFSLLAGLRLRAVQPPLRKAKGHLALMGQQISKESDGLLYLWLLRKCEFLLSCLPTSLEDDLTLLKLVGSTQDLSGLETIHRSHCKGIETSSCMTMPLNIAGEDNSTQVRILCEVGEVLRSSGALPSNVVAQEDSSSDDALFDRWMLALRWRIGYKQILHRCCILCRKKIRILQKF